MNDAQQTALYAATRSRFRDRVLGDRAIAIASVVIAAASAFFSFYQIEVLKRERMTPYRAILYSEKLQSFRRLNEAVNVWDKSNESLSGLGKLAGRSTTEDDMKLYWEITAEQALWPAPIHFALSKAKSDLLDRARREEECAHYKDPTPRPKKPASVDCFEPKQVPASGQQSIVRPIDEARRAMLKDLQTDDLQRFGSD